MSHKYPHPSHSDWEAVIGLEIHVELNTKSKLFSVAPNHFGDDPNTNITEVCTGQPGALPVLNKEAVRKAVQFGCAIQAKVAKFSKFDRKSYFYPDSPRNFQITQYDQPIVLGGTVIAEVDGEEKSFAVNRVHLEDDAGMLKHFSTFAGVDYNRAGCPLIEIVSEPCIHTPREAVAYAMAIKAILQYIDASDCNMEEGSLRVDTNVSVRLKGENKLRNKIEIKNMNSFSFMEMALKSEINRQIQAYLDNPHLPHDQVIEQATYRWDPEKQETVLMRRKESADDYRYFPEPDLVPIILTDEYIEEIREGLPELPLQRERRYVRQLGLSPHHAFALTSEKALADYFEKALNSCSNARSLANWLLVEFPGRLKESGEDVITIGIKPEHAASLINLIEKGTITGRIAKSVADDMVAAPGKDPAEIVAANPDYKPLNDQAEIERFVDQVLAENGQSVVDFKAGRDKAFAFLVGQVMKLCKGKASPQLVNDLLKQKISQMP
ncbi:Asp-tRNA(Asn)/Glu-tRNA(Gln) amidotransferase subunit GatB [Candidatus Protochlamydia phocaeensis]|uniref:Asp-tRNA(Asn)/Glu-tRNA(Gln) amidotransferase subunit GatB n=1 Tax=Candidatus Protochlamydia phocaeensis TaxID=1414722 RepID=UPI000838FA1C|nr:Asp-tRNA(Asn)/Glu-tRNA(Gln) amidotransferase subunit GatB [Candidatus Protochlamydia phocaeensis]